MITRSKLPLLLLSAAVATIPNVVEAKSPNVIFILGDDYSMGEHGIYGNKIIQTPNLDNLCKQSVSFDNFHVGPTSSPTRAQLMSGRHEFRVGVTHTKYPRAYLALGEKLLPEYFNDAGYETAHFGKWHLGNDVFDDEYSARARGFKHSIVSNYLEHFDPEFIVDGKLTKFNGYRTDILFDEAEGWIDKQLKSDNPFFCYIATNSAHMPFDCPQKYKDMYKDKLKSRGAETCYGMVTNIDENVGGMIEFMKAKGIFDNTLLIYMTDNGHVLGQEYNAGMRGQKGSQYRGGTRVPCLFHYPDSFDGGRVVGGVSGAIDLLPTLAEFCDLKVDKEIDGVSLAGAIKDEGVKLKDRLFVTHVGRWDDGLADDSKYSKYSVYNSRYTLVNNKELYDIKVDPAEKKNVIGEHPELVAEMRTFYDKWWAETRPLMVNDELSYLQGGSRLSIEDVEFRKMRIVEKSQTKSAIKLPLVLDMVHHNPGEAPYKSQYTDPKVIKKMGYNGKVYFLFESPMLATTWETVDKDILPKGTPDREWADAKAAQIRKMQSDCKASGVDIWAQSDMVLFPKRLVEKYKLESKLGNLNDRTVKPLIKAQIGEMFDQFPDLDGLVVRIGETYLHDAPYHIGAIDNLASARKTIVPLILLLREEICVKRNKMLIFRTWRSFDLKLDLYKEVSESVEPHPNLVLSVKHCEGDFHRANDFSKVIGEGRHPQIIEVQCAREYEGKGAYPNYIANGVIEGFEEYDSMPKEKINSIREFAEKHPDLYAGTWTWTRGGGWEGPYVSDEMWCDLNAWVISNWAKDPTQSEEEVFNRYAAEQLKLKGDDIAKFRKLALLSADAVVRGINTVEGDVNPWWTRDEGIGWPVFTKGANLDRVVAQRAESVEIWHEIVKLAKSINWSDKAVGEFVEGSTYYGLYLYEIYESVTNLNIAEKRGDKESIAKWIKQYDKAWASYEKLPKRFKNISTLYTQEYRQRYQATHADSEVDRLRAEIKLSKGEL
ncbi:MAG: arylsulfatase [Rikenellaceae bacterium]